MLAPWPCDRAARLRTLGTDQLHPPGRPHAAGRQRPRLPAEDAQDGQAAARSLGARHQQHGGRAVGDLQGGGGRARWQVWRLDNAFSGWRGGRAAGWGSRRAASRALRPAVKPPSTAAARAPTWLLLPAVVDPPFLNTGLSWPSEAGVVPGRMPSSWSITTRFSSPAKGGGRGAGRAGRG